jgi:hypothetical protein
LQKTAGIPHRLFDADLIREERHVGDDERPLGAACHGARVVDHRVERDGQRGLMPKNDRCERIADEDDVDAGAIEQAGHRRVVRRQHGDLLARLFLLTEFRNANAAAAHRVPLTAPI